MKCIYPYVEITVKSLINKLQGIEPQKLGSRRNEQISLRKGNKIDKYGLTVVAELEGSSRMGENYGLQGKYRERQLKLRDI